MEASLANESMSPPTRFFVAFTYADKTMTTDWTTEFWKEYSNVEDSFHHCHQTRREVHMVDTDAIYLPNYSDMPIEPCK